METKETIYLGPHKITVNEASKRLQQLERCCSNGSLSDDTKGLLKGEIKCLKSFVTGGESDIEDLMAEIKDLAKSASDSLERIHTNYKKITSNG